MSGARFNFILKDQPGYNPYGKIFTERQESIIRGVSLGKLKKQEITTIIRKAEKMGLPLLAEEVYEKYEEFLTGKYVPKYTIEEAKEILQSLTPWEI